MKKKVFAEPVRDAGKIHGGERESVRLQSTFLDFAGSVDVPPKKQGASWNAIKAATWRLRAAVRK